MIVASDELLRLNSRITRCKSCPRLSRYIRQVGKTKVKRFSDGLGRVCDSWDSQIRTGQRIAGMGSRIEHRRSELRR
jgi:hypothetical protein